MLSSNLVVGQNNTPYFYNPDSNGDWFVGVSDLVDLLSLFGTPLFPPTVIEDSLLVLVPCVYPLSENCDFCQSCESPLCIYDSPFSEFDQPCSNPLYNALSFIPNDLTVMFMKPDENGFWHIPYGWEEVLIVDEPQLLNDYPKFLIEEFPGYNYWELDETISGEGCWNPPYGFVADENQTYGLWNGYSVFGEIAPTPFGYPKKTIRISRTPVETGTKTWAFIEVPTLMCAGETVTADNYWNESFHWVSTSGGFYSSPLFNATIIIEQNGPKKWRQIIQY